MGYALLALVPIAVVFLLMVAMGRSARLSMGAAYVVTVLLVLFVWQAPAAVAAAATVNGLLTAFTLLYIVFGAILLLNTLKESGRRACEGKVPRNNIEYVFNITGPHNY